MAGAVAAAITTPLDVCKTLINTQECCNPDEHCKTATSKLGVTADRLPTTSPVETSHNRRMNAVGGNLAFVRSQSTTTNTTVAQINGLKAAALLIYKVDGLKGFAKGLMPRTIFQIPGTAVSWSVYEYFKHKLKKTEPE